MRSITLLVGIVALTWSSSASATTINFDSLPLGTLSEFSQDGYFISWHNYPNGTYAQEVINIGGGNQNVVVDESANVFGTALSIRRLDGFSFTVLSADIANLDNTAPSLPLSFGVPDTPGVGDGPSLSYYPSSSAFVTVDPSSLLNSADEIYITLIDYDNANFAVDNIVLETVPEPSTALLLAVGLIGLGVRRRTAPSR